MDYGYFYDVILMSIQGLFWQFIAVYHHLSFSKYFQILYIFAQIFKYFATFNIFFACFWPFFWKIARMPFFLSPAIVNFQHILHLSLVFLLLTLNK